MKVNLKYFAQLKELSGRSDEVVETGSQSLGQLYAELRSRYQFPFSESQLKAAINDSFCALDTKLKENDRVVFIPPVAGG